MNTSSNMAASTTPPSEPSASNDHTMDGADEQLNEQSNPPGQEEELKEKPYDDNPFDERPCMGAPREHEQLALRKYGRGNVRVHNFNEHAAYEHRRSGEALRRSHEMLSKLLPFAQEIMGQSKSHTAARDQVKPHLAKVEEFVFQIQQLAALEPTLVKFRDQERKWAQWALEWFSSEVRALKEKGVDVEWPEQPNDMSLMYAPRTFYERWRVNEDKLEPTFVMKVRATLSMLRTNHMSRDTIEESMASLRVLLELEDQRKRKEQGARGMWYNQS